MFAGCGGDPEVTRNDLPYDPDIQRPDVSGDVLTGDDIPIRDGEDQDVTGPQDVAGTDTNGGDTAGTDTPAVGDAIGQDTTVPQDAVQPQDTNEPGDNGTGDPDVVITPIPFACASGKTVVDGVNKSWTVAGKTREFTVKFPDNPDGKPVSVIFVYHGFGDSVANFMKFFGPNPDADPDFPFVLVYPKSLALKPYGADKGIEWTILNSQSGDNNLDAKLFEEILGCLDDTVTSGISDVFVFGFSAGAIFGNLLHSRYPDLVRSVMTMSGAWFNDDDTVKGVNTMGMATLGWDDLDNGGGTVFMTHGGTNDTYGSMGITIIDFEKSAGFAVPHLTGHDRTVIDCPHTSGHTNHPGIGTSAVIRYFKDHRGGVISPWVSGGLPAVYPEGCEIK